MPALDPKNFDPTQPIVMARNNTVGGHALRAGEALTIVDADEPEGRGEVTLDQATTLWARGTFVYLTDVRPTPVESPQDAARRLIEVDELGGGWYLIRAPWLPEGEKVQGAEATETRKAELIAAGQPTDVVAQAVVVDQPAPPSNSGPLYTMTEAGSNGYYQISGPGLAEPEKVRGEDKAAARLAELEAAPLQDPPKEG
jgi:hypothetical protein